jgi:hypothetical protein
LRPVVTIFSRVDDAVSEWLVGDSSGCVTLKAFLRRIEVGQVCLITRCQHEQGEIETKVVTTMETQLQCFPHALGFQVNEGVNFSNAK